MSSIPGPKVRKDNPDRHVFCEEAIEEAFQNVAILAEAAGWDGDEVATALVNLADHHIMTRAANVETDQLIDRIRLGRRNSDGD